MGRDPIIFMLYGRILRIRQNFDKVGDSVRI